MSPDTSENVLTPDSLTGMGKEPMVMRSIRVQLGLWDASKEKADQEGSDISSVVRELLEEYLDRPKRTPRTY